MKNDPMQKRMIPILADLYERRCLWPRKVGDMLVARSGYHSWKEIGDEATRWERFPAGSLFGGIEAHHLFRTEVELPESYVGRPVVCRASTGATDIWNNNNPQFFAYVDGRLTTGLDVNHTEFLLVDRLEAPRTVKIEFYAYTNAELLDVALEVSVAALDEEVHGLYFDLATAFEAGCLMRGEDPAYLTLNAVCEETLAILDLRDLASVEFAASVKMARAYLAKELYSKEAGLPGVTEYCVGHTHIDVAWLWSLDQTREKVIRSWASVDHLMHRYPEYRFMASQPQLYQYLKQDEPELYSRVKGHIAAGRWEPEGGMWLEADCNLTSGESLVRQLLYGKRFFKEELGVESRMLWLPDVFGYSAALPQIMAKSGIDYFMTTKIAWNDTNQMPHDTMMWRGIDGTEVLTHFITTTNAVTDSWETTYNGRMDPNQVLGCWRRYSDKTLSRDVLQCYGFGDGGGGVTFPMLERQRRMEKGLPGLPRTRQSFAIEFFEQLEKNVAAARHVPKWVGELYLEYHRGTLTTIADIKKNNRKAELALMEAEWLCSMAALWEGKDYPAGELERLWKILMLNQFHDTLPGSAIGKVYEDSALQFAELFAGVEQLADGAVKALVQPAEGWVTVFGPTGYKADAVVSLPAAAPCGVETEGGQPLPASWQDGVLTFLAKAVPEKGWQTYRLAEPVASQPVARLLDGCQSFETAYYTVDLNGEGEIVSLWDKRAARQVIAEGAGGNRLEVWEDRPKDFDGWNVEASARLKRWGLGGTAKLELLENSAVCLRVGVEREFLHSRLRQQIVFYGHTPRIDFVTEADWHEEHLLLKAIFPVDVRADRARYDIQFGSIERDTHDNTSWDEARFEVCGHKWAALSEAGYGVALLNDCKYGYDIKDGELTLSLLRAPTYPYADADRGQHSFTYSLLPFEGDFSTGGVVREGYLLNQPARAVYGAPKKSAASLVRVEGEGVVLETVKQAEGGEGTILRLYESCGGRAVVRLHLPSGAKNAMRCDLMENREQTLDVDEQGCVVLRFAPFEIVTVCFSA